MLNKIRKLQLPVDLSLQLFDNLVLPVLLYGCEVWGYSDITQIEVLHRKFIKILLGINASTPNVMVYGESGHFPVLNHVICRMIAFYMRLENGNHFKISYIMFQLMRIKVYHDNFEAPWIDMVRNNLCRIGMRDIWEYQGLNFSTEYVKLAVKRRIMDIFLQDWSNELQHHDYCVTYRSFKKDWQLENYLVDLSYFHRLAICKFRCRSNYIPISKTRFKNFNHDDLICPLCDIDEIADETHLLFNCPFFLDERNKCFTSDANLSVESLFITANVNLLKLANFTQIIMDVFKELHQNS